MFNANIKLIILLELDKAPRTGLELIKDIEAASQKRPSPGYIYPLLHRMKVDELISVRVEGRKKIYSITTSGKSLLRTLSKSHEQHMKWMENFSRKGGGEHAEKFMKVKQRIMDKHMKKMVANASYISSLQKAILTVYESDYNKKEKEMRSILENAAKKMKELAEK